NVITINEEATPEEAWQIQVGRLPVVNTAGKLVGIATRTDLVTAFYRQLKYAMKELKVIINSTHNSIIAIDSNNKIIVLNKAAENLIGINASDVLGKQIDDIIPNSSLTSVIQSCKAQYAQKMVLCNKSVLANKTPIIDKGKVIGGVGVFQDISELEMISHELRTVQLMNKELNTIIDFSADGIVVADNDGVILNVNDAYRQIMGIGEEKLVGKPVKWLIENGYLPESVILKVLKTKTCETIALRLKTGQEIILTGTPVFDGDGNIYRVIANVRDLTELSNLREQLKEAQGLTLKYFSEVERYRLEKILEDVVYQSKEMVAKVETAIKVAQVDSTVLLLGESGVGKEVIAEIIHKSSNRSKGPLIKVNCASIPHNLIESELFGYEGGAFTGAFKDGRFGFFELAKGGTIFLDEIGEVPLDIQPKLLRVLQEQEIYRIGGRKPIKLDIRVIAATNRDLEDMIKEGKFRQDLFYRLNVISILIPPLRQRLDDIPALVHHFLQKFNRKYGLNKKISSRLISKLVHYQWPGNIRELENTIERMVILSSDDLIDTDSALLDSGEKQSVPGWQNLNLYEVLKETEKNLILQVYNECHSTHKAAQILGVNQSTIVRKLHKYFPKNRCC
ncbi:MAG: sigma 54-interacting transcriptional regulator, partial [Thermoanaerobacterium sp.]|nr:sigma 54-interacting transcriptional regulator [Thermoanaerobacterium sp.]